MNSRRRWAIQRNNRQWNDRTEENKKRTVNVAEGITIVDATVVGVAEVEEEGVAAMIEEEDIRKQTWAEASGGTNYQLHFKRYPMANSISRTYVDKRERNNEEQAAKRRKFEENGEDPDSALPFSKEEIANEERKPKKKVAVLVGYAGTGYKGMQINSLEKTIEGDLFKAFVAAGAISKANADDPKKSSLVRCARTDKGVHAAGNVISLKLIVEDPNVVAKINENLPPQIRVWGIERTNGAFSCYQACDSRWYEYLIPTYSFIPPHPQSFLGKKLVESSEQEGIHETYQARQADVADFWKNAEAEYVKPILDKLTPEMRAAVMEAVHTAERDFLQIRDGRDWEKDETSVKAGSEDTKDKLDYEKAGEAEVIQDDTVSNSTLKRKLEDTDLESEAQGSRDGALAKESSPSKEDKEEKIVNDQSIDTEDSSATQKPPLSPLDAAIKEVKAAYVAAKKVYRISEVRRKAVQDALGEYLGTINFYNYTIQKTFKDPSAKRMIRSFKVGTEPIIINDTEWLSLKVHGQSFMMHQIRKMVAMVALVVRCGTGLERMRESFGPDRISIPKAPGLGLLLERPVFDTYNSKAVHEFGKEKLDFGKYEKTIEEFKQKEIYERIFRVENEKNEYVFPPSCF